MLPRWRGGPSHKLRPTGERSAARVGGVEEHRNLVPEPALGLDQRDEARVGQKGSLEYIWAPIGSRPRAVRDNRHDSVYLFGALCAYRAVGAAVIMPAANTDAMNEHLKEISTQVAPGAHAVLVCDGAGWHQRGGKLKLPDNITLVSLPPYSPELNPMENVWDYLRGNELSHLVWDSYEAMVAACAKAWRFLVEDPDRIRSIAHRHWATVNA